MGILRVNWLTDTFHADDNLSDPDVRRLVPGGVPMVRFGPFCMATHQGENIPHRWQGFDSAERLLLRIHYPGWALHERDLSGAFESCVRSCEGKYSHLVGQIDQTPMEQAADIAQVLQRAAIPLFLRLAFLSHLEDVVTARGTRLGLWVYETALQTTGKVPVTPETFDCLQFAVSHVESVRKLQVDTLDLAAFRDSMFSRGLTVERKPLQ